MAVGRVHAACEEHAHACGRAATFYEGDLPPAPGERMTTETDWGGVPSVLRVILGRRLERPRIRAGLGYAEAGAALGAGRSTIRRMEAAEVARPRLADAEKPLQVHGVTGPHQIEIDTFDTFPRSVREANKRGRWHGYRGYRDVMPDRCAAYLSLERAADRIRGCRNSCVPGLSQTEDCARALLRATHPDASAEATERRLAPRTRRQRFLAGARPRGCGWCWTRPPTSTSPSTSSCRARWKAYRRWGQVCP